MDAPDLRIITEDLWRAAEARRGRARATFVRTPDGRLLGRPSGDDFESPYLLSGLARCAPCGGALVGLTRTHGRGRQALYGCAYHHKRGAAICTNGVQIRQDRLETAFLAALHAVLDARMIEDAVREALTRLRQEDAGRGDRQATLIRERSLVEARVRHLLDAVTRGHATDALLRELEAEDARKTVLATELATLADQARVTTLDAAQMSRTLTALAADVQTVLAGAPGQARQMLRKLFAGHQIACVPFVDPDGTRGYTFEATGTYAALLAGRRVVNDGGVPDGIQTRAPSFPLPLRCHGGG